MSFKAEALSYAEHTPQIIGWCEKGTHPYPSLFKAPKATNQPTNQSGSVDLKNLRYGKVLIMVNQDQDGSM